MKLYYNPRSRAAIAKWMLDECDADYEIVYIDLEKGEQKAPEFLEINPAGKLPALVDGTRGSSKPRQSASISATSFRKPTSPPRSAHRSAAATSH
jgi:glutathione S-transferase